MVETMLEYWVAYGDWLASKIDALGYGPTANLALMTLGLAAPFGAVIFPLHFFLLRLSR